MQNKYFKIYNVSPSLLLSNRFLLTKTAFLVFFVQQKLQRSVVFRLHDIRHGVRFDAIDFGETCYQFGQRFGLEFGHIHIGVVVFAVRVRKRGNILVKMRRNGIFYFNFKVDFHILHKTFFSRIYQTKMEWHFAVAQFNHNFLHYD